MRSTRRSRPAGLGILLLLLPCVAAPSCVGEARAQGGGGPASDGWSEGPVEVVRIFQPGIVQIGRDGRTAPLHLAGVDGVRRADTGLFRRALERLNEWVAPGGVSLTGAGTGPGGELVGSLRLEDGSDLGERLLRSGLALYRPQGLSETWRAIFAGAQRDARLRERGLWGLPEMEISDVARHGGRVANVCADALTAQRQADGSWRIYLGSYPQRELGIRVPAEHAAAFGAPRFPFLQHEVCVRGRIERGDVLPEVTVFHPTQIEKLGFAQSS